MIPRIQRTLARCGLYINPVNCRPRSQSQVHCFALPAHFHLASIFSIQRTYFEPIVTSYQTSLSRLSWVLHSFFSLYSFLFHCMTMKSSTCEKQFSRRKQSVPHPPPASPQLALSSQKSPPTELQSPCLENGRNIITPAGRKDDWLTPSLGPLFQLSDL